MRILGRFLPYLKEYKRHFFISLLGMVAAALATSASAYLVKPILDHIFIQKDSAMLSFLPPLVIVLYAIKGFGKFIQIYYTEYIGQEIITKLRAQMLQQLLLMPYGYFVQKSSGKLISRLTNDINRIKMVVANLLPDLLREILTALALVGVVIYQSPKLALYFLFIMPLAIYPLSRLAKRMKKASKASQEKIANLTSHLMEIFTNIELIKAEAKEKSALQRFHKHNQEFFHLTMKQIRINNLVSPLMELLGAIVVALVIYVGGKEVLQGHMSTGAFFSFMTALFMLYAPIKRISSIHNQLQDAVAAAERIFEIIDLSPSIAGGKRELKEANRLCFEKASLHYEDKAALQDITFCANKGEITALVGKSGSGKSSIVSLILRFYEPNKGHITIDGVDIREFDLQQLRSKIAFVTQRIYLFKESIAYNVALEEDFDKERLIKALKKAQAWEFVQKLPQGIYTKLAEAGASLSGGQRQRLAIARALYKDALIFIFDEATSALDKKSEEEIFTTIQELAKEHILLLISHNIKALNFVDKLVVLQDGKIVCKGDPKHLKRECAVYKELLGYNYAKGER